MQKTFLLLCACFFSCNLIAQTSSTLYSENFNGASHTFTLNTTDQSSNVGGANLWIVNNSYTGGSGSIVCLGFPFSFSVPNTNSQPTGITGNPNSNYMHILSTAAQSSSLTNACYSAADGLCTNDENYFTKMSADFSTMGFDSVEVSFWWLCAGEAGTNYGELYYSTNAGSSWTLANATQYQGQSNWTQAKVSIPAFEAQSTLRFGFRFVNATASSPADPSFSLDDIQVTGFNSCADAGTITTAMDSICSGDSTMISWGASSGNLTLYYSNTGSNYTTVALASGAMSFNTGALVNSASYYLVASLPSGSCATDTSNIAQVTVIPSPVASFTASQQFGTFTTSFNNSSTNATSYFWEFGDGNTSSNTSPTYTYSAAGSYSVTLTAVNALGCTDEVIQSVSVVPVGIEKLDNATTLRLYPNPNNGTAQLDFELLNDQDITIRIYSSLGQLISNQTLGILPAGKHNVQLKLTESLPTGSYILELQTNNTRTHQKMSIIK